MDSLKRFVISYIDKSRIIFFDKYLYKDSQNGLFQSYPKHRHPGWNHGSIAYHADDGQIFEGNTVGIPFGPPCDKGDIMGCGIIFPRDYVPNCDR